MDAYAPFFTFMARIPPYDLGRLSPDQIADHLHFWNEINRKE